MLHWLVLVGVASTEWISPAPWYGKFNICPSAYDPATGDGCWAHRIDETKHDEYCQMVNGDCAPFTCLSNRVVGKLRYDLFDQNEYALDLRDALRAEKGSTWPYHRFFTVGGHELINSTECTFHIGDEFFEFDFELGECGAQLKMDTDAKVITYGYLFELNDEFDGTIEFFVDNTIQIDCAYNTELTLDASSMFINQEDTVVTTQAHGQLQDNFNLRVYADSQYKNEVKEHNILNMGQVVYVAVEQEKNWAISTSGERLVWFIDTCSISDESNQRTFDIIEHACYNDLVNAQNQNLPYTRVMVDHQSKFKFNAFGFENLTNQNAQSLTCQIRMCIQYGDGSLDTSCSDLVQRECGEHFSRKEVTCDNYDDFLMRGDSCQVTVEQGKQFSQIKFLSESFKFNFDFTPQFNAPGNKRNIMSLVSDGRVFLTLNILTFNELELCYTDDENYETCKFSEPIRLTNDQKSHISVEHSVPEALQGLGGITSSIFVLRVNGEHAQTLLNAKPVAHSNVTIWMGDQDMPAAFGLIDDFHLFDLDTNTMLLDAVESESDEMGRITGGVPVKSQLIETFVDWGVEYQINVDVQINANLNHEMWGNVLHFGRGGANEEMGDRVPAIFVAPKSQGKRLFVCSSVTYPNGVAEKSHCTGSGETDGDWVNVRIEQVYESGVFVYRVYFNDALAEEIRDVKVQSYGRVHLWASNPWSIPARAQFRALEYVQPRGRFLDQQQCEGDGVEWTPWLATKQFKRKRRKRKEIDEEAEEGNDEQDEIMTWLKRKNKDLCSYPSAIQAQTEQGDNYTKNNLRFFSRSQGIKCTSRDQPRNGEQCDTFQARFCCPKPRPTQLDFGTCEGPGKSWTEWSSIDSPNDGMGDFERYRKNQRNELVYMKCAGATAWQARTETGARQSDDKGLIFSTFGLFCHNRKQPWGRTCHDYSLRYCCVAPNRDEVLFQMEEFFNGENYTQLINEFEMIEHDEEGEENEEEEEVTMDQVEYTHERFEEARNRITAEISEFFSTF